MCQQLVSYTTRRTRAVQQLYEVSSSDIAVYHYLFIRLFVFLTATVPLRNRTSTGLELFHLWTRLMPRSFGPWWLRTRRNHRYLGFGSQSESSHR